MPSLARKFLKIHKTRKHLIERHALGGPQPFLFLSVWVLRDNRVVQSKSRPGKELKRLRLIL